MSRFFDFIENNFGSISSFDKIQWMDIVEILLIAVFVIPVYAVDKKYQSIFTFKGYFDCGTVHFYSIFSSDEYHIMVGL